LESLRHIFTSFRLTVICTSDFVADILSFRYRPMSGNVGCVMSWLGVVKSVGVAVEISFVVVNKQRELAYTLISKHFLFSGRHIGFLEGDKYSCISIVILITAEVQSCSKKKPKVVN